MHLERTNEQASERAHPKNYGSFEAEPAIENFAQLWASVALMVAVQLCAISEGEALLISNGT